MSNDKEYEGPDRRDKEDQERMIKEVAEKAAHEAVVEVLEKLGVDLQNHLEMQEDFAWMRRWRQMSEKVGSRVLMTLFTVLTVGIAGLVWSQMSGGK